MCYRRMDYRVVLLVIFWGQLFHLPVRAEVLSVTVPFMGPGGDYVTAADRYHTYRIPGMIVAADGSIAAFAEGRRGDGSDPRRDENAPIDIVMRRSADNGQSWQPQMVVEKGFRSNGDLVDFGDPTPVLDDETKTIFLFFGQWPDIGPRVAEYGQSTAPADGNQTLWFRSSTDNGETWSERQQVIYADSPDKTSDGLYWRYLEPGPGNGIQLRWQDTSSRIGRLIIPVRRAGSKTPDGPVTIDALILYSDDHGKTWQLGNPTPGPEADEAEVIELTDGRILLDSRQGDGPFRCRHLSTDGGLNWGANDPSPIPLTQVDASLARFSAQRSGHDRDRILFSAPSGIDGLNRKRICVWTSYDEGKTFDDPVQFNRQFAAYSVVQRLADGTIGLLVETGGDADDEYGAITFYRFDLSELESQAQTP